MKHFIPILLSATLAVAAPTNSTLEKRDFQGSIQWFKRWDCKNHCVEDPGYCLSGQEHEGIEGSVDSFIG